MRCDVKAILLLAMSLVALGQAVKDPVRPNPVRVSTRLQLVASLEQTSVKIGDPVRLRLHFKNVSSEVVGTSMNGWATDFWLTVIYASGTELPRTKEGDRMLRPVMGGGPPSAALYCLVASIAGAS